MPVSVEQCARLLGCWMRPLDLGLAARLRRVLQVWASYRTLLLMSQ